MFDPAELLLEVVEKSVNKSTAEEWLKLIQQNGRYGVGAYGGVPINIAEKLEKDGLIELKWESVGSGKKLFFAYPKAGSTKAIDKRGDESISVVDTADGVVAFHGSQQMGWLKTDGTGYVAPWYGEGDVLDQMKQRLVVQGHEPEEVVLEAEHPAADDHWQDEGKALPSNPRKINIDQARMELAKLGYQLGVGKSEPHEGRWTTTYEVTKPNGQKIQATATALQELIYGSRKGWQKAGETETGGERYKASKKDLPSIIRRLARGNGVNINEGDCLTFAGLVEDALGIDPFDSDRSLTVPIPTAPDGTSHIVIKWRGKYYDAENPDGVADYRQLNYWKRHSKPKKSLDDVEDKCTHGVNDGKPGVCPDEGGGETGDDSRTEQEPGARQAPGSQMPEEHREKLRELGMVGTFPPANKVPKGPFAGMDAVVEGSLKMIDLGKEAHEIAGALLQWNQRTESGRISRQYRYTEAFNKANADNKWRLTEELEPHLDAVQSTLSGVMADASKKPKERDAAAIASLVLETGLRPTDGKESVAHGHFGIASLQARHVKDKGDKMLLDFIGKEGVRNRTEITDPANVAYLRAKLKGKSGREPLWSTGSSAARKLLKQAFADTGVEEEPKLKDLRTIKATQYARELVGKTRPPKFTGDLKKDTKALNKAILAVSGKVAKVLNNSASMARDNYINPRTFAAWKEAMP